MSSVAAARGPVGRSVRGRTAEGAVGRATACRTLVISVQGSA